MDKDTHTDRPLPVRIYYLLIEGWTRKNICKHLNISDALVRRWTKRYEDEKRIYRVSGYPVIYAQARQDTHTDRLVGDTHTTPQIPRKFGAAFSQNKKPPIAYHYGMAIIKAPDHTIIFRKVKTTIWLKTFTGTTPDQQIANGKDAVIAIASEYERLYGLKLTFERIYPDIEWIDTSRERSAAIADGASIKRQEQKEVAGAIHKYGDSSDKDWVQFNAKPGGVPTIPTEHAKIHFKVYSGEYDRRFEMLMQLHEKMMETIVAIRQRMEMEK